MLPMFHHCEVTGGVGVLPAQVLLMGLTDS